MSLTVGPRTTDAVINKPFTVPRKHLRFALAAEAEVKALTNGLRLEAGVSELSPCGCYLDTPTPFSAGTEVHVLIRYRGRCCELHGRVIYAHKGWGMGVLFGNVAGQQFEILDSWLVELEHKRSGTKANRMVA